MAEVFQHHGFKTALIADNPHIMKEKFGFGRGFEFVKHVRGQTDDDFQPATAPMIDLPCPIEKLEPRPGRLERYRRNAYWYRQQGSTTTQTVCAEALSWLDTPPERFFLWIDCFDPHEPWDAPAAYAQDYTWDKSGDAVVWPRDGAATRYSRADVANMRTLYKAEVTLIDECVGKVLEKLRQSGLLNTTAFLFCSDHGYYLGEHQLVGKLFKRDTGQSNLIYNTLGHIPLLIRHPQGLAAGKRINGLCQPPDLFATALELAGIPRVGWIQGNSLVPRINGQSGNQQFAVGGLHPHPRNVSCVTVWSDEWSLIYYPQRGLDGSELYREKDDPLQTTNVLGENRRTAEDHLQLLRDWFATLNVPPARQRQMLQGAQFGRAQKFKHQLWMLWNRVTYQNRYRGYARSAAA
jgi:arylsulfatase A-like enzyme